MIEGMKQQVIDSMVRAHCVFVWRFAALISLAFPGHRPQVHAGIITRSQLPALSQNSGRWDIITAVLTVGMFPNIGRRDPGKAASS